MKIEYANMQQGASKPLFLLHYLFNVVRTWWLFHFKYPWVKYNGFVRVMKGTGFAKGFNITLGNNVQFGNYCNVATSIIVGNYVLMAGRVGFVGKNDHTYNVPGQYIWNGERGENEPIVIENDVWIGHAATIVGPVHIGCGSIVAAGAVVTCDIPPCEIWGGVPAKKIRDRFASDDDKKRHLIFIRDMA